MPQRILSFLLVVLLSSQIESQEDTHRALHAIGSGLVNKSATLDTLLTHLSVELNLPWDLTRLQALILVRTAQEALVEQTVQAELQQRWEATEMTQGLKLKQGVDFLQALARETEKALQKKGDYLVSLLVDRAATKTRLPSWQAKEVLRVATGAVDQDGVKREPVDTLALLVLSQEVVDQVPGILDSDEKRRSYQKYAHLLHPTSILRQFWVFFLTETQKQEVWTLISHQLEEEGICRTVVKPSTSERIPSNPSSQPLLVVYTSFFIPEANPYGVIPIGLRGQLIPQYQGLPPPMSKRIYKTRNLSILYSLFTPESDAPIYENSSHAEISVEEFGPNPDPTDTRQSPAKVTYNEPIVEPVFIEFFRQKLTRLVSTQEKTVSLKVAPDFILQDTEGEEYSLSANQGKVVVLEWTNPECPFTQRHYREGTFKKLWTTFQQQDIVWLAINSTTSHTVEDSRQWKVAQGIDYPLLVDTDGNVGQLYGARATPHLFVINRKGRIVYRGAVDDDPGGEKPVEERTSYVRAAVDAALADKIPEVQETAPYGCAVKYAE